MADNADYPLNPDPILGIRTSSKPATIKAAATALTTSYVAYPTDGYGVLTQAWSGVRFRLGYTNGDETSIQFYVEGYDGTQWGPLLYKADQATAVSEMTPDVYNITKATINTFVGATTLTYFTTPAFDTRGFSKIRIKIKSTGGTPTGTVVVMVIGIMDISGRSA